MRRLAVPLLVALALPASAQATVLKPSWGYANIDDRAFFDTNGALLPANQAFPRGQVKDGGTSDGWAVKITVSALSISGATLASYSVSENHAVYTNFDRRLDVGSNQIASLRFDLCRADGTCVTPFKIARPAPGATPTPQPGPSPEPTPAPDRDGDGFSPPADCDDTNSAVHPGAREISGNGLDDDCSGGDTPARVAAGVSYEWRATRTGARVLRMRVSDAPSDAAVEVRCGGRRCPFKRRTAVPKANGSASLTKLFKRSLRAGVTIDVRITAPNSIGKVLRFEVKRKRVPQARRLCLPPGAAKPGKC
jgi:Putative metal-binding motif